MIEPLEKTEFYGPKIKKTTDFAAAGHLSLSGIFAQQEVRVAYEPRDMFA
jgi:hypothetical protein